MKIPFNILSPQYLMYKNEYDEAALRALNSGWYILGKEVTEFEKEFSNFVGSKYCVSLNSGLDALILAIRALEIGKGGEVIAPANTYIASILGITENGATPIFVEPDEFYNIDPKKIEEKITGKTKAIMVVHLYGQSANMEPIVKISGKYNIPIVEDCAQAHGATYNYKNIGTFGEINCFSFYPTKNLGAFGDGGAVVTNNPDLEDKVRMLRNYGSKKKYYNEIEGVNSRLDELQAALLKVKLKHIRELEKERADICNMYLEGINNEFVLLPKVQIKAKHVWHQFVIRCEEREKLIDYLLENGIKTMIHYPIPPHLSKAYERLGYKKGDFPITEKYAETVLSLPLYNGMEKEKVEYVIDKINKFEE